MDGGGQPGNFLNIKTATCVSGMSWWDLRCWSDVLLSRGKILNTEIITIQLWKTGWKPTFQREASHYCWAEPERVRLGCSPLAMASLWGRHQISAWKKDTALAVVLLSEGKTSSRPGWVSLQSGWREATLHFKWEVWTSEISAAAVRGLGERWLK